MKRDQLTLKAYLHMYHNGPSPIFLSDIPYETRVAEIKKNKPTHEHELRLRLFKPFKGKLPSVLVEAWKQYYKAWKQCCKAKNQYVKARRQYGKTLMQRDEAKNQYVKTQRQYVKALKQCCEAKEQCHKVVTANLPAILELHAKECPDCPWDGNTIFPEETAPKEVVDD